MYWRGTFIGCIWGHWDDKREILGNVFVTIFLMKDAGVLKYTLPEENCQSRKIHTRDHYKNQFVSVECKTQITLYALLVIGDASFCRKNCSTVLHYLHSPSPCASHLSFFTKQDVYGAEQFGLKLFDMLRIRGLISNRFPGSPTVQNDSQGHAVRFLEIRISSRSTSSRILSMLLVLFLV